MPQPAVELHQERSVFHVAHPVAAPVLADPLGQTVSPLDLAEVEQLQRAGRTLAGILQQGHQLLAARHARVSLQLGPQPLHREPPVRRPGDDVDGAVRLGRAEIQHGGGQRGSRQGAAAADGAPGSVELHPGHGRGAPSVGHLHGEWIARLLEPPQLCRGVQRKRCSLPAGEQGGPLTCRSRRLAGVREIQSLSQAGPLPRREQPLDHVPAEPVAGLFAGDHPRLDASELLQPLGDSGLRSHVPTVRRHRTPRQRLPGPVDGDSLWTTPEPGINATTGAHLPHLLSKSAPNDAGVAARGLRPRPGWPP